MIEINTKAKQAVELREKINKEKGKFLYENDIELVGAYFRGDIDLKTYHFLLKEIFVTKGSY